MVKPVARPTSDYTQDALQLLGALVREARIAKAMTVADLASRAMISRSLVQRIEKGDAGCAIGAVFEVAAICGVPLFEADARLLAQRTAQQHEKMSLLPKAVRTSSKAVKDDF